VGKQGSKIPQMVVCGLGQFTTIGSLKHGLTGPTTPATSSTAPTSQMTSNPIWNIHERRQRTGIWWRQLTRSGWSERWAIHIISRAKPLIIGRTAWNSADADFKVSRRLETRRIMTVWGLPSPFHVSQRGGSKSEVVFRDGFRYGGCVFAMD